MENKEKELENERLHVEKVIKFFFKRNLIYLFKIEILNNLGNCV